MVDESNTSENQQDQPAAETAQPAEATLSPEAMIAALNAEAVILKDQLLRAVAETENTRRRLTRERDETAKFAASNFARDILSVADNLRRAIEAIPAEALVGDESLKSLYEGVAATERQLEAAFAKHNIRRIFPEGEKFDSNLHQAMFEVPGTDKPQGTIVQVLQAGYVMHDRLLRPAMVGVAKGEPRPATDQGDAASGGHVDTVA